MGIRTIAFLSAVVLASCGGKTEKSKPEAQFTGEDLFIQRCASCHGVDGGLQASLSPDLRVSILTAEQILKAIDQGGNGMPAFKTIIESSKEKKKIVDHVLTLRK